MSIEICVVPEQDPTLVAGLKDLGVTVTDTPDGADAMIWMAGGDVEGVRGYLSPSLRWVQLPSAGVERWVSKDVIDRERQWTSAASAYNVQVAEHTLALLLAGLHAIPHFVRAHTWAKHDVSVLAGATVLIVGAGGIGESLVPSLTLLGADVIAVNRSGRPVPAAKSTHTPDELDALWGIADHIVLVAPATPETYQLVNKRTLEMMQPHTWIVNVGRGSIIDSDALADALDAKTIAGAALDVTDPEPLPADHRLWSCEQAVITSHSANELELHHTSLIAFVLDNARRFCEGSPLLGTIDLDRGY